MQHSHATRLVAEYGQGEIKFWFELILIWLEWDSMGARGCGIGQVQEAIEGYPTA